MIKPVQLLQDSSSNHLPPHSSAACPSGVLCWKQRTLPAGFVLYCTVTGRHSLSHSHAHSLKNNAFKTFSFCSDVVEEPFLVPQNISVSSS